MLELGRAGSAVGSPRFKLNDCALRPWHRLDLRRSAENRRGEEIARGLNRNCNVALATVTGSVQPHPLTEQIGLQRAKRPRGIHRLVEQHAANMKLHIGGNDTTEGKLDHISRNDLVSRTLSQAPSRRACPQGQSRLQGDNPRLRAPS
jgi:hypothetical protein